MTYIIVMVGSMLGGLARFSLSQLILNYSSVAKFNIPIAIMIINAIGCLFAGILFAIMLKSNFILSDNLKLFLLTGLLGGFTTFSAFSLEFFTLFLNKDLLSSFVYLGLSIFIAFASFLIGFILINLVG